jgi:uncharacterized membrane protein
VSMLVLVLELEVVVGRIKCSCGLSLWNFHERGWKRPAGKLSSSRWNEC